MTASKAQKLKLIAACAFAFAGVVLVWRAIAPSRPLPLSQQYEQETDASASAQSNSRFPRSILDEVNADNVADRAKAIGEQVRSAQTPYLTSREHANLADAVRRQFEIYLGADFDGFVRAQEEAGAARPYLNEDAPEEEKVTLRAYWMRLADTVAMRPISVDEVLVRLRYIDGREVPQPDLGGLAKISASSRYGLDDDPIRSRLTVYEVLVPVLYKFDRTEGPVWWGMWFAQRPFDGGAWLPYKSVIYDTASVRVIAVPGI